MGFTERFGRHDLAAATARAGFGGRGGRRGDAPEPAHLLRGPDTPSFGRRRSGFRPPFAVPFESREREPRFARLVARRRLVQALARRLVLLFVLPVEHGQLPLHVGFILGPARECLGVYERGVRRAP